MAAAVKLAVLEELAAWTLSEEPSEAAQALAAREVRCALHRSGGGSNGTSTCNFAKLLRKRKLPCLRPRMPRMAFCKASPKVCLRGMPGGCMAGMPNLSPPAAGREPPPGGRAHHRLLRGSKSDMGRLQGY
jgi:hypothetical protein